MSLEHRNIHYFSWCLSHSVCVCYCRFTTAVKELRSALEDVLKSDEDLAHVYLTHTYTTGTPRPLQEHTEAEVCIHIYVCACVQVYHMDVHTHYYTYKKSD